MIFIVVIISLLIGSFATCFGCRLFSDNFNFKDLVYGRSKCNDCHKTLKWFMLIPVVSYFSLGRKCFFCNSPVSLVYPIFELLNCLIWVLIYFVYGLNLSSVLLALTYSILMINVISDLRNYLASDFVSFLATVMSLLFLLSTKSESVLIHIFYTSLVVLFFYLIAKITSKFMNQESLGFGDIKGIIPMLLLCNDGLHMIGFMFLIGIFGIWFGLLWQFYTKEKYMPYLPVMFLCSFQLSLIYEKI
jgi:leader peptidase (prepilin peptidase)/N-methyltransferase